MVARCKQLAYQTLKLGMLLVGGLLQAVRRSNIKLDMMLDGGSLQAARLSGIKLDMLLYGGSHIRHKIRYFARWWLACKQLAYQT